MRTEKEIKAEITRLKTMKPNVRRASMFGDNHHDAIDAQVDVLDRKLTPEQCWDEFADDRENIQESAREAAEWLVGDTDDLPSKGWKELLFK